jgi:hypothetical protein
MFFKNSNLLESRELSFQIMVSGTRVLQGSCAVSSFPPTQPAASHADLKKVRLDFIFLLSGNFLATLHRNTRVDVQLLCCSLGLFIYLFSVLAQWPIWLFRAFMAVFTCASSP